MLEYIIKILYFYHLIHEDPCHIQEMDVIMLVGGYISSPPSVHQYYTLVNTSEIISGGDSKDVAVKSIAPLPERRTGMVGMYIGKNKALFCGGFSELSKEEKSCLEFSFDVGEWNYATAEMNFERDGADSVKINNGSNWWITGGKALGGLDSTDSTEILDMQTEIFTKGPKLPEGMDHHCVSRINSTHLFITSKNRAFLVNEQVFLCNDEICEKQYFIKLPYLKMNRYSPACTVLKKDGATFLMVAGGVDSGTIILESMDTTEVYDLNNGHKWEWGPLMNQGPWSNGGYITYEKQNTLILLGGLIDNKDLVNGLTDTIINYDVSNSVFEELTEKLSQKRAGAAALGISLNVNIC